MAPDIGILTKPNGQLTAQNDHTLFTKQFLDYYHHCLFTVTTHLIKDTFVGAQSPGNAQAALQNCHQVYNDPVTCQLVFCTIQQYYDAFISTLIGMPPDRQYTVDVAHTFFHNLEKSLKDLIIHQGHVFPEPPPDETNADAQERIHDIFVIALQLEQESDALMH